MNRIQILIRFGLVVLVLEMSHLTIAQVGRRTSPFQLYSSNIEVTLTDKDGRPSKSKYSDVEGNPYYTEDYKLSTLYLIGSRKVSRILAKLDMVSQEVILITGNNQGMAIPEGNVKEMDILDSNSTESRIIILRTGFPAIDNQNQYNFYEVTAEGKITMLKCLLKKIVESKNEISGEITKSFESDENYYFFKSNEMKRLKRDKSFILNLFPDNREKLEEYIRSSNINFKSFDQVAKLVEYYNSIQ